MADDRTPAPDDVPGVDPKAFLAAILQLDPDDAKRVREATPEPRKRRLRDGRQSE